MLKCHQNKIAEGFRVFTRHTQTAVLAIGMISCFLILPTAFTATYYVSDAVGDNYYTAIQALNINTPWKTIQKAADIMVAGDTCVIMAGTYRETVTPANSGTAALPITFTKYTDGGVTISGTEALQSWTRESSGIYYTPMNWSLGDRNQVFQNFAMRPEARWPNNSSVWQGSRPATPSSATYTDTWSYLDTVGYNGYGWFTDAALPTGINWTGCMVHIMSGAGWIMMNPTVTGYDDSLHKLTTNHTYSTGVYAFSAGNEYYITGSKSLMDADNEWFYDSVNSRLYYHSSSSPTNVEAKKRNYGFDLSGKSNIKLYRLAFYACTIKTDIGSNNCIFDHLAMQYLSHSRQNAAFNGITLRNDSVLSNSELTWDSRGLVMLAGKNIRVVNNNLHDSGYNPYWTAMVDGGGTGNLVSHNTMYNSGRALQGSLGMAGIFEYNNLYNAMKMTTDGGIFYTANTDAGNTVVRYNLMHDSTGPAGHSGAPAMGFYLDAHSSNWIIHHNIIWGVDYDSYGANNPANALLLNNLNSFMMVFNNTTYDVGPLRSIESSGTRIFNNLFTCSPIWIWEDADIRYNLDNTSSSFFTNPPTSFQLKTTVPASPAIDAGIVIPGITVGTTPDMGALESGGTDWTTSAYCGYNAAHDGLSYTYAFPSNMIFCNKINNGGFESGSLTNWTASGTVSIAYQNSWADGACTRIGYYSAKLSGNSEINQTITGLQSDRRYMLYAAVKKMNADDSITIGAKGYGRTGLESITNISASVHDTDWHMYSLPFVTGPSTTQAQAYIKTAAIASAAYVDDVGLLLCAIDEQPPMPLVHYPLNETSGLTAHNRTSGAGLDGTLYGNMLNADWVTGKIDNALDFDGIDDYVNCGSTLQLTGDLTLSFWIKPPAGTPLRQNPLAKSPYGEFALTMETGPTVGAMTYYHGVSTTNYWGYRILPAGTIQYNNTWQHITITRDATNHVIKSYYNGELINTVTYPSGVSPTTIGSNLTIGDGYAGNFAGQMDDVRIYDCALTDQMVADLYKVDDDQVLHMMFDEGAGAVKAGDCSGYGFLGTRYGTMVDPDWVDGKIGNALDFDGTNDYVSCDNDSTVTLPAMTGDLTLSFWVKPTDVGLHRQNPLAKNPYGEFGLTIEMDGMLKYYHGTSPSNYFSYPLLSAGTISNGEWQHIAVTRNATDRVIRGYYNGELITTTSYLSTKPPVSSSSSVMIGGSFGQYFYGQIDDVRIYKKCLNEQEILDIARMLNKPYEGL